MLFAFENLEEYDNFIDCPDVNPSGIRRFSPCPISTRIIRENSNKNKYLNVDISNCRAVEVTQDLENYIISSGVNHSPNDWCGADDNNVFAHLSEKYLSDLRNRKALLLLDQSHEGYQTKWLWQWFHKSFETFNVPAESVIYVTGNLLARKQYAKYCAEKNIKNQMQILPYTHFENMIYETGLNRWRIEKKKPLPTFEDQLRYKTEHLADIKDYNFLQKRLRSHRAWGYKAFHDGGLLPYGLLSMNSFKSIQTHMEGKFITEEEAGEINKDLPARVYGIPNNTESDEYYITRFNDDVILDSWVSVISEASFSDKEGTCFISEKSFKPIACYHPFIIFGNKNSLHYLRDLGYKSFHPFIDESYDKMETWDRLDAIVNTLKKFNAVENKIEWYKSISDILHHNAEILRKNSIDTLPTAIRVLDAYYRKYFNVH